ncbi:MAG: hypothetical protein R3F19_18385 [Verrucomicrobiales bacterium]
MKIGSWTLYHSGDTLWHAELVSGELRSARPIDVMFLRSNGNKLSAGSLEISVEQSRRSASPKTCGAKLVIPCHYDMFTFNTETPEEFLSWQLPAWSAGRKLMQNGQHIVLKRHEM